MDQVQPGLTLNESVAQVMQTLPPPIRSYLAQGKYTLVAKNLMTKYALRIDQGGVLEREIMLLLMGIDAPDEFIQTLADEAKLDQQVITSIVQDVNAQIFVPLREEMMKSVAGNAQQPLKFTPPPISPPAPPRPISERPINAIPTGQSARPSLREALASVGASISSLPKGETTNTNRMLEDHEEPHIEFKKAPTSPKPISPSVSTLPKSYSVDPYREPLE